MGDRMSFEALQRPAYIGRTRNNTNHAGKGREVHFSGVRNVKVDGYCAQTKEVFEYLGCFGHGYPCVPNRLKPIGNTEETSLSQYEETEARLKKSETLVNILF